MACFLPESDCCTPFLQVLPSVFSIHSPATRTHESCGMTFINENQCSILLSQITDTLQRSHIPIHGEHAVCDHQPQTRGLWGKASESKH